MCQLVGRPSWELVGERSIDVMPEYQPREAWEQDEQSFSTGLPGEGEQHFVDRAGMVWYTGNRNAMIGRLDPATGAITRYLNDILPKLGDWSSTRVAELTPAAWQAARKS